MDKPGRHRQTCRISDVRPHVATMPASTAPYTQDRLPLMLLIAIGVHLVLLFVLNFKPPEVRLPHMMEVTLALHRSDKDNPDADFLAQANQQGSGSTSDPRLITNPYQSPFRSDVSHEVQPQQTAAAQEVDEVRRQVIVTSAASPFHHDNSVAQDLQQQQTEAQQEQPVITPESAEIATIEARVAAEKNDYAKRTRVRTLTSVSTSSSSDAAYLDAFRTKVEQIGNRNYPDQARAQHMVGNVRLLVALNVNGSIKSIAILQGSGYSLLDDAAVRSVRMAAPFPAFPLEVRRNTDVLQIIRTWKFTETLTTTDN